MKDSSSDYIDLLKKHLCDYYRVGNTEYVPIPNYKGLKIKLLKVLDKYLRTKNFAICEINNTSLEARIVGGDWPINAETMIGLKRLDNLEFCVRSVVENNVAGDLIELGVWRGGASILMRAVLKDMKVSDRTVWLADSFEGLPAPDPEKYPADKGDKHFLKTELSITIDDVKHNFKKYNLLDAQVKFLKGWFKDTLPGASINKLAVLRLDGDMYESTMDGLVNLYAKVSKGGFIIVDDWGAVPACKKAVEDYRQKFNITDKIIDIDGAGVYWQKSS